MTIVAGKLLDRLGHASQLQATPGGPYGFEVRRRCFGEPIRLRATQDRFVPLDVDHVDPIIGRVLHLEQTDDQDTWAVAQVDNPGALPTRRPLYFSAKVVGNRAAAELLSVAVTDRPAMVGLPPLQILPGLALDDQAQLLSLRPTAPHMCELLQRTAAALRQRRPGDPVTVADQHDPVIERGPRGGLWLDGQPLGHREPTGPLRLR